MRKSRDNTKVRIGTDVLVWSIYPQCSPQKNHTEQTDISERSASCTKPMLKQRKSVRKKEKQRDTDVY